MEARIADIRQLLTTVPEQDRPTGEQESAFWFTVAIELRELLTYASRCGKPQVVFTDCRQAGSQYLWEFWVNDLEIPYRNEINWHGQNVSQWQYAGAICLSDGRISRHH